MLCCARRAQRPPGRHLRTGFELERETKREEAAAAERAAEREFQLKMAEFLTRK